MASEKRPMSEAAQRLSKEFAGTVPEDTVEDVLNELLTQWETAPVTTFVPVLAERFARERLRELARQSRAG